MNSSTTFPTPAGPLTVVVDGSGTVRAAGFTSSLQWPGADPPQHRPDLGELSKAIQAYLDGDLAALDGIPVEQSGGGFHHAVWQALRRTRPGEQLSYSELAARAGRPAAVRAAAQACARNSVALFVPCHRVVRTDGGLGGYRWGIDAKRWLLAHEGETSEGGTREGSGKGVGRR